ncbi:Manganese transport protein MntH [Pseudomonas batumici]|uniref:Manganese transport protein MntH n=2 Tax=Pseudomonas batumici TaxID=226910 RepID=A0A0C2I1J6_9PSED|nr:Manganese transport protein MntH [Pseudomonas batumici]
MMPSVSIRSSRLRLMAAAVGPGLVVMLADTEAGSVITAAQSGAQWGYRLLLLQFLIIPLLYTTQELSIRLGLGTGKGFGELVRQRFGRGIALLSLATLVLSCFGALVTELSGLAGVGQLFGVPLWETIGVLVVLIFAMVCSGSYHGVERVAICLGLFGVAFIAVAWNAHPDPRQIAAQWYQMPLHDSSYLYLVAANLGTSVMPWTVFYQQSALIDKGLGARHLKAARIETLLGATLCQILTAAVVIAAAACFNRSDASFTLTNVPQLADAFTASLGQTVGRVVFAMGLAGGALVATIVVCLTVAWGVGEATGRRHSLEQHPTEAPWFYAAFAAMLLGAGALVGSGVNLVELSIFTGVVNALLLPAVLGLLYWLARTQLTGAFRLQGGYARVVGVVFGLASLTGLFCGVGGLWN